MAIDYSGLKKGGFMRQISFVKYEDIETVKEELAKGGCKPGVCGPRVRTVTACQGNGVCPSGNIESGRGGAYLPEICSGRGGFQNSGYRIP